MPEQRMNTPEETHSTPTWLGSYDMEIRRASVQLPKVWRPEAPLSVVRLAWDSPDDVRTVWLIPPKQLKKHLSDAGDEKARILAQDEILLKPDGLVRLPDVFLEGFSGLPDARVSLVGMYNHIEIYRQEDREKLENSAMTFLDELCRELEKESPAENP